MCKCANYCGNVDLIVFFFAISLLICTQFFGALFLCASPQTVVQMLIFIGFFGYNLVNLCSFFQCKYVNLCPIISIFMCKWKLLCKCGLNYLFFVAISLLICTQFYGSRVDFCPITSIFTCKCTNHWANYIQMLIYLSFFAIDLLVCSQLCGAHVDFCPICLLFFSFTCQVCNFTFTLSTITRLFMCCP